MARRGWTGRATRGLYRAGGGERQSTNARYDETAGRHRLRIVISGAGGFIGRHLVLHLQALGHETMRLARRSSAVAAAGGWIWPPESTGADAVVHLAALNPSRRDPASGDIAALTRANVDGTRVLAEEAGQRAIRRMVFLSTAHVHASQGDTPIDEASPCLPQSPYAASKFAAELALEGFAARTGLEVCVLRPPPVFGPGGRGTVAALQRLAALPLPLPLGEDRHPRSILGIDNCVGAIERAIVHPHAAGGTFLLADDEPRALGPLVATMRKAAGRPPRLLPFPASLVTMLAGLAGRGEAADRLLGAFVLDDRLIRARLGWRPLVSTEDGFRRMLAAREANR